MTKYLNFYYFPNTQDVYFRKKNNKDEFIKCDVGVYRNLHNKNGNAYNKFSIINDKTITSFYNSFENYKHNTKSKKEVENLAKRQAHYGPYDNLDDLLFNMNHVIFKDSKLSTLADMKHDYLKKTCFITYNNGEYTMKVNNVITNTFSYPDEDIEFIEFSDDDEYFDEYYEDWK